MSYTMKPRFTIDIVRQGSIYTPHRLVSGEVPEEIYSPVPSTQARFGHVK